MILVSVAILFVALLDLWVLDRMVNDQDEETPNQPHDKVNEGSHDANEEAKNAWNTPTRTIATVESSYGSPEAPTTSWQSPSRTRSEGDGETSIQSPIIISPAPPRRILLEDLMEPSPLKQPILLRHHHQQQHQQQGTHQSQDRALEAAERLEDLLAVQVSATQLTMLYSQMMILSNKVSQLQQVAATKIHHCYRSYRRRRKYLIRLQSWSRMVVGLEQYQRLLKSAILVQSLQRGRIAKRYVTKQRQSIRSVQHCWRKYLLRKYQEQHRCTKASIRIQSQWRSFAARTLAIKRKRSVLVIQITARRHLRRRRQQQTQAAAIRIQAFARREVVRDHWKKARKAATCIQSFHRQLAARAAFTAQLQSVQVLQRVARRHYQRHVAAVQLQSWYRMQTCRQEYVMTKATTRIQCWHRCIVARNVRASRLRSVQVLQRLAQNYQRRRVAAIRLQSWYRMQTCRQQYLATRATIRIQCWHRGKIARNARVSRLHSVQVLQRMTRNFQRRREAAIRLQAWYRMQTCRQLYVMTKAAIRIQCWHRGNISRNVRASRLRGVEVLQRLARNYQRRRVAAIRLQAWYRMQSCRQQYVMTKAAIRIQCCHRCIVARNARASRLHSVQVLQRMARNNQRRCVAAIRLQAWYRMQTSRRQYVMTKAAIRIQCCHRGTIARNARASRLHSVQVLQRMARNNQRRRVAAIRLQAWYRMQSCRQLYVMTKAAIRIQCCHRCIVARNARASRLHSVQVLQRMARNFQRRREAAIRLQAWYRMQTSRRQYAIKKKVAICMQKLFRGRAARDLVTNQQRCIVVLKRAAKHSLTLLQQRNVAATRIHDFHQSQEKAQMSHQVFDPMLNDSEILNASAKTIQSITRMFLARRYIAKLAHPLTMTGSLQSTGSSPSLIYSEESLSSPSPSPILLRSRPPSPFMWPSPILSPLPWQEYEDPHLTDDDEEEKGDQRDLDMTPKRQNSSNQRKATEFWDNRRSYEETNVERQAQLAVLRTFGEISARRHSAAATLQRAFLQRKRLPSQNTSRETRESQLACFSCFAECINFLSCTSSRAVQDIPATERH